MSLETDLLLDRRRLKRRLSTWRVVALASLLAASLALLGRFGLGVGSTHLARLNVSGVITEDSRLTEAVSKLADDDSVPALIVTINSPGGSVSGGESLHDAIAQVAAKKPVVAVMGGTAASAGYMIAVPATRIFARQGTLTGSIGVLLQTGEVSGLLDRLGIQTDAITSGPLKAQPNFLRPLSPAGRDVLQGLVMDMYDQFVEMVAAGRHLSPDRVRELGDGRAYTGRQALKLGLIDQIGGEPEARAWLAEAHHIAQSLPVRNVTAQSSLAQRMVGASFGAILSLAQKSLGQQWVRIDGAWAIWQPSAQ